MFPCSSPPEVTAWTTMLHMEKTMVAVEEESTPPLRGRKKPP